ncbi:MAG: ABC transporter permease [Pseudomonadota bacterium]
MIRYILRRLLYAIPILIGVNIITFLLFFVVNTPDDMARIHLGAKHVTPAAIEQWKAEHGYDKPLFINGGQDGIRAVTDTLFVERSLKLFSFDFGKADDGRDIARDIETRMWPSLAIALPVFIVGLLVNVTAALLLIFYRSTRLEYVGITGLIALMSISSLFYIIAGQYFIAILWKWLPISGYAGGIDAYKFILLPVLVSVAAGLGSGARWYRSIFLEEIGKDYVRTARAKGLSELRVLFSHVLKNGMIPILTGAVVVLPLLFTGSLVTESFFGIPGLGSYTIDAIRAQDFAIVQSMVFLGSALYILGLLLTDLSYTLVDPRVKLT